MSRGARGFVTLLALWLALVACAGVWMNAQRSIDRRRDRWPASYPLMFLPSGQYLHASSLGYRVVMADLIYLWSIQYYGHHRTEEGRRYLWHIYDVITDLDPHFLDAYLVGALIMAVDMRDPEMAIRLLEKGMRNNPEEWLLPVDAGFYCYQDLEDYRRAASYFEQALQIPGVPPAVARLRAGMYEMAGDLRSSLRFWREIYQEAEDERIEQIAWQHVYDIQVELHLQAVGEAVRRYQEDRGRRPQSLEALVRAGYLQDLPRNPVGRVYLYDPATGEVSDPGAGRRRGRS